MSSLIPFDAAAPAEVVDVQTAQVEAFRSFLHHLPPLMLSALLRELAVALYNSDIGVGRWRVLLDVSDELLDSATEAATIRLAEKFIAALPESPLPELPINKNGQPEEPRRYG